MANEVYMRKGTSKYVGSGAGYDVLMTIAGLTNTNGRISAQIDWGAAPRPDWYSWSCELMWQATPTTGAGAHLYVAGAPDADSTQIDTNYGASDGSFPYSLAPLNAKFIGSVIVDSNGANAKMVASGRFRHTERYMSILVHNMAGATLHNTAANLRFDIVPFYWQGQ